MKRFFAVIVLLLTAASTAVAQETVATVKYAPVYLGVNGAQFCNKPVFQPDLYKSWKSGISVDAWFSTGKNGEACKAYDEEIDLTAGYAFEYDGTKFAIEAAYFFVQGIDVLNLSAEFSTLGPKFSPFMRAEFFAPRKSGGPARGLIASGGVRSRLELSKRTALSLELALKHDSGTFGYDNAALLQGKVGFDVALTSRTTLLLVGRFFDPITKVSQSDGRKKEAIGSAALAIRF